MFGIISRCGTHHMSRPLLKFCTTQEPPTVTSPNVTSPTESWGRHHVKGPVLLNRSNHGSIARNRPIVGGGICSGHANTPRFYEFNSDTSADRFSV